MSMTNSKEIFEQMHHQILEFIRSKVNDESTAKDILQEVFLKIHENIETVREQARLQSWVFQITRNAIIDYYRTRTPAEHGALLDELPSENTDPTAIQKLGLGIHGMINGLPEIYKEALVLTELEGMSQKDFARRFGLSYSAAKSRVQRARAALKHALLECCHFELDKFGTILDYHPVSSCCCCADNQSCSPGSRC